MPELPEVETVKNALKRHLLNRTIYSCEVFLERMILSPLDEFKKVLTNRTIIDIERKGKYLIFLFDNEYALISHLRMEGKYLYFNEGDDNTIHTRVVFHMDRGEKVIYDDSRSFGIMELVKKDKLTSHPSLAKLGPEPMVTNGKYLYSKTKKSNKEIKNLLLDQTVLSGLGNIYVDETCFASKINPYAKASSINEYKCSEIINNASKILLKSIQKGGSTVSSYHPENGVDGKFQNELFVYGRKGLLCQNCHHHIAKDFLHGRGTSYCPNCQNVAKRVGIYGKIASGKSTVNNYFKNLGYKVFSCDDVIRELYLTSNKLKEKLKDTFSSSVLKNNQIDREYLKNIISSDEKNKIQLEKIIHPLVKEKIEEFTLNNKEEEIVFIEIPLLFESRCEGYCDFIIGIDASKSMQLENLKRRGSLDPDRDLKINQSSKFDKNVNKCNLIITNNSSLENFYYKLDKALIDIKNY